MKLNSMTAERKPTHNSTFAIDGVSFSADSFVVTESSVLRMNICVEKPAHRKSAKRVGSNTQAALSFQLMGGQNAVLVSFRGYRLHWVDRVA
jgi:hypothetical protein